jgi:uncharacterized membrane protein
MTWTQRYRLRHYLSDSVWILPCVGIVAALVTAPVTEYCDRTFGWRMDVSPDASRTVLITLASAMFSFVVYVSSALLIALQLASAQLTPRIIALVFRDPITKFSLTVFVFTFTLTVAAVLRINDWVPSLTVHLAAYGCVASMALFLYLIDHIGKVLRPANALRLVASLGRQVIESVYPDRGDIDGFRGDSRTALHRTPDESPTTVPSRKDGVILACDIQGIAKLAALGNFVVEIVPQVGDFVAKGDPLFRVYGGTTEPPAGALRPMVAIGGERSLEQDPMFAFRIIVDIASKALSPAINDPTTAVLAIDQLQHLLGLVGGRRLGDKRVTDGTGPNRVLYRTPGWEDFVHMAVTEVRQYGCQSIQVTRRLHAMLESLLRTLPEQRTSALRDEVAVLSRSVTKSFAEPEDRNMAADSDSQGVGGGRGDGSDHGARRLRPDLDVPPVPTGDRA